MQRNGTAENYIFAIEEVTECTATVQQFPTIPSIKTPQKPTAPMQDSELHNFNLSESNFSPGTQGFGVGFSIREIADEIRNFEGPSMYPNASFSDYIANISELYNLTDIQTLNVVKRCLTSTAKIFLNFLPTNIPLLIQNQSVNI